MLIIWYYLSFK